MVFLPSSLNGCGCYNAAMPMKRLQIVNRTRLLRQPLSVRLCDTFSCRFLGLMGRRSIAEDDGLLFVWPREGRDTAIHMLFMRFPIAVVWLDGARRVVDARLLKPWVGFGVPRSPARYVLELHPVRLAEFQIGDEVTW